MSNKVVSIGRANTMYYGKNDAYEFYQSEDRRLLLMRTPGSDTWTAHRNFSYVGDKHLRDNAAKLIDGTISNALVC